jgi:(R,R)-butanediol dehydrogenase / meso-butanediol dehydrogenase / diacetyl reductase
MKAAVFRALHEPLVIEEVPDPRPAADEVVIRVGRCGICGSDLHMTHEPAFGIQAGTVLGHEFAGEVVELGRSVELLNVGDLVAVAPLRGCGRCPSCMNGEPAWCENMSLQGGGYAEFALAADRQCLKLPSSTSIEDGALVEPLAVALHGVGLAGLSAGARVLVIGAGPIGLGVAYWARRLGATRVVVTDLTTLQSDLAFEVGATAFVKSEADVVPAVIAALGGSPDIVFECAGKPGLLAQALAHVRPRGRIIMLGLCTALDGFVPFQAVSKEARFIASAFFNMREFEAALDVLDGGQSAATAMVTDTVSLSGMPATFEALRRRTSQCKVLVRPD